MYTQAAIANANGKRQAGSSLASPGKTPKSKKTKLNSGEAGATGHETNATDGGGGAASTPARKGVKRDRIPKKGGARSGSGKTSGGTPGSAAGGGSKAPRSAKSKTPRSASKSSKSTSARDSGGEDHELEDDEEVEDDEQLSVPELLKLHDKFAPPADHSVGRPRDAEGLDKWDRLERPYIVDDTMVSTTVCVEPYLGLRGVLTLLILMIM